MNALFQPRHAVPMFYQAETNECGLACLAMVSSNLGKHLDIRTLRSKLNLPASGASVKHLVEAAKRLDLHGRPLKLELSDLHQLTLPAILHWDLDHFVVLKKQGKRSAVIHDPAVGIRKYDLQELGKHFTGVAIEFATLAGFETEKPAGDYSLRQLFQVTPGFYRAALQVFLLSLLIQMLALLGPLYLQLLIDQGLNKGDMDLVTMLALLFGLVTVGKILVNYLRGILLLQFSNQLGFQLVSRTFSHLLHLPLSFFQKREPGDIVSRFSSLESVKQLVTQEMITVVVDGLFSLITIVLLYLYSPLLASLVLGSVFMLSLVRVLTISGERNRRQEAIVNSARQQSRFLENISSIAVTKLYGIEQEREEDWQGFYANHINAGYHLGYLQLNIASVQGLIQGIEHIVTLLAGAMLVHQGQLSLGQLMSFLFLKQHFSSSISGMLPKLAEIRMMKVELERISDITLQEPEHPVSDLGLLSRKLRGSLKVEDLCFNYQGEDPLLHKLNFEVDVSGSLAITGVSGSGKSTLLKLLLGLENPSTGQILIDSKPLSEYSIEDRRDQIAAVMHNDKLLVGDIAYNINLGKEHYNLERLRAACERADILEAIELLPLGFNTQVGAMGNSLSAGQVQRILLARALYRLPKILILDEAFSHLDIEVAEKILRGLHKLGITVLYVSHNPRLVDLADQVLVVGEGDSKLEGNKEVGNGKNK